MSLLEAANCDTRDSLLLESELELFMIRRGGWQGGKGPDFATLQIRKAGRAEERAIKLVSEILLEGVTARSSSRSGQKIDPKSKRKPPAESDTSSKSRKRSTKTRLKKGRKFLSRMRKAKEEKNLIKFKRVVRKDPALHT